MKKLFIFLFLTLSINILVSAQNNIEVRSIEIIKDKNGIPDGTYKVSFKDNTIRYLGDNHPNNFTWYLSYKGKRVSDYYYSAATSMSTFSKNAVVWPDEIPKGYEKYVSIQLGKEPVKKDRRDDD